MTTVTIPAPSVIEVNAPKPLTSGKQPLGVLIALWAFVVIPFAALIAAVPLTWNGALNWAYAGIFIFFYFLTCLGVTTGFHRYFTHNSFKAKRGLRIMLAIAGSLAVQGEIIQWVADHRRHHAFSDVEGDPHSPWRFGNTFGAVAKGLWYAHMGWLFHREFSNRDRFAPDLVADRGIRTVDKLFGLIVFTSLALPALAGGLITWSWQGALWALFWGGLVRISFLHHVTWSINSVCHVVGDRPFTLRKGDKAANFWPLAILSCGESWHNLHHAEPTCARHGVDRGQIDISARLIWIFERFGWAYDVRWPRPDRLATKRIAPA